MLHFYYKIDYEICINLKNRTKRDTLKVCDLRFNYKITMTIITLSYYLLEIINALFWLEYIHSCTSHNISFMYYTTG